MQSLYCHSHHWGGEENGKKKAKLMGWDKGSLTEQQTKQTVTTTKAIRRIYKTTAKCTEQLSLPSAPCTPELRLTCPPASSHTQNRS